MPRILRRTPPPADCCRPYYTSQRLGIFPDPDPPEPPDMFVFVTTVTLSGGGDSLDSPFGGNFFNTGTGIDIANWLQANVTPSSGASLDKGDSTYSFWVLAEAAPSGWTWNGGAIVFSPDVLASLKCWTTGSFNTAPDSGLWQAIDTTTIMGVQSIQGMVNFEDPGFLAAWAAYAVQIGGVGAVGTAVVGAADVTVTISNTYLTFVDLNYFDGGSTQVANYSPC